MEQVKVSVDYTKARVRFVREASQNEFAKLPVQINFLVDNKFIVRYGIRQNKIIQILFDCYEFPNSNTLETMHKYLSIDDLKNVHVVVPEKDNKISIWLWPDVVKRVQENNKEKEEVVKSITKKEVSKNGKSQENNLQDKPWRNKVVDMDCDDTRCKHRTKNGHCRLASPLIVDERCHSFIEKGVENSKA